jgi:opacity protein-like surface antigen
VKRRLAVMVGLGVLAASAAWAQDPIVELGGRLGWTFSDGVGGGRVEADDGNVYDRANLQDSLSFGAQVGFFATPKIELGLLWARQQSTIEVRGTRTVAIDDLPVSNYHFYIAVNLGDHDSTVRPYVLAGAGATAYGDFSYADSGGTRQIDSQTKFSTTWGLGVKFYPNRRLGLNLGARWTPTYIWYSHSIRGGTANTRGTGWWCQPEAREFSGAQWGCYLAGNGEYSNQIELSGGFSLRF